MSPPADDKARRLMTDRPPDPAEISWHVDRRIPAALIVTFVSGLVMQTMIGVWFASKMDSRIQVVEDTLAALPAIVDRYLQTEGEVRSLREATNALRMTTDRIENKVDRLIENGIPARRLPGAP